MIHFRRGVADHVDVLRDEMLTVVCPLADQACLNAVSGEALANKLFATCRSVPLPNMVYSMKSSVKAPHDDEGLNPKEQARREELVDRLAHFLDAMAAARNPCKVLRPESTCIPQLVPDLCLAASGEIFNLAKGNVVFQVANVPLQPALHQVEAREKDLPMVYWWIDEEPFILASSWVRKEAGERSMENPDRVSLVFRDK